MKGKGGAPLWVLGLMSGTSLDGVDGAVVLTDGVKVLEFGAVAYRPYTAQERSTIRAAFGVWHGDAGVAAAALVVEDAHIEICRHFPNAQLVGFHGQTLAHDPGGRGTHQAGSGARLAQALGLPVVWDFRSADVAAGGQGAPLVPFFHHALARRMGADQPVAILNLGGVGNLTWIDPHQSDPAHPAALLAFDTGPANAPLNDLMLARLGQAQDEGGAMALLGVPDQTVIATFLGHPYFQRFPPKSLDRNAFDLLPAVQHLSLPDALATLTHCAAAAVAQGARHFPAPISQLLVAGGGRHNGALMQALALHFPQVVAIDAQGLNGDMLEAQAFAYLAARVQAGLPTSSPQTTGVPRATIGGQITRP
jgi:anhydro-N-acetylmuramic acid kinase